MDLDRFEKIVQLRIDPDFHFIDNRGKEIQLNRLNKPISQSKVALISSGGFHLKDDKPFNTDDKMGDTTFRKVPRDASINDLSISHTHYKHDYVLTDLNCALPSEILIGLEKNGLIGEFFEDIYTFSGYILNTDELINITSAKIASILNNAQVDAAILAPTWPICNQSVGLMARELERRGIATIVLNMFPEVAYKVVPPRAVITQFVFGAPFGNPGNKEVHTTVVKECLKLLEEATDPGTFVELPLKWEEL